jgi:putative flavoprotein involved in K+ transport
MGTSPEAAVWRSHYRCPDLFETMECKMETKTLGLGGEAIELAATRARAGLWIEPGAAFARLESERLSPTNAAPDDGDSQPVREEKIDAVVIGAGQSGLSVGHFLAQRGVRFVILEAGLRIGDSWRRRWDSLRLFTPARFDSLAGMPFPVDPNSFPTKDEMAEYLEAYSKKFALPTQTGVTVTEVTRDGALYRVNAGPIIYLARHVIVAAASYQLPKFPPFAADLNPVIFQIHSSEYKNPAQLRPGRVLLVGAGNSGAELAIDLAATHQVSLAGRHPGHIPFAYNSFLSTRLIVRVLFRGVFHRLLSVDTPFGRKAKPSFLRGGLPLIRVKPQDLDAAQVRQVPRVAGVNDGKPMLEGGETLNVENVVWCTGFSGGLEWIKLRIFDASGRPNQYRGVVKDEPGLYFCGLPFQHSPSSTMVHGAARDAKRVADKIVERLSAERPAAGEARR